LVLRLRLRITTRDMAHLQLCMNVSPRKYVEQTPNTIVRLTCFGPNPAWQLDL
jgi:hypothetical protein